MKSIRRWAAVLVALMMAPGPVVSLAAGPRVVGDGEGWRLWDEQGKLTIEGRGATGERAVVSSGKYEASSAGREVLKAGGNAVDAAIAVAFALSVTEPNSSGIGGGGFMILRSASGEIVFLDFRERAPEAATPALWQRNAEGRVIGNQNMTGGKAVAVPGEVAGLWHAFHAYGSGNVTWSDLLQPAIRLAEEGFVVTPTLYHDMAASYDAMVAYPEFGEIFLDERGLHCGVGEVIQNPDLGRTLRRIAEGGRDAFYTGDMARAMVESVNKYGGVFTLEDLASYEVRVLKPVAGTYRGYRVYSSPLPSSGGTHILQALNILENFDIQALGHNETETLHILSEAFGMVFADRARYMGDPGYVRVPARGLLDKAYAARQAAQIRMDGRLTYAPVDPWAYESEQTTHFSIADIDGNVVGVTQTVNGIFGAKVAPKGCGFVLNNEMGDFSPHPASPNAIAPGKTPLSSMSPTILLKADGTPLLVAGSPGSTRIITTLIQIISNVVDHGMAVQEAIDAPRIYADTAGPIEYEKRLDPGVVAGLVAMGYEVTESDAYARGFGSVQAIAYGDDGRLYGGADPRRDGKALGF